MGKVKGYIVRLTTNREEIFKNNHNDYFGEPVPEFNHSRNIPLMCFVISNQNILTNIALGKKGYMAGTGSRRLNLKDIFKLETIIYIDDLIDKSPKKLKSVKDKLKMVG